MNSPAPVTPAPLAGSAPRTSGRHSAADEAVLDALAQRLLADHVVQVGRCSLVLNQVCDCVIGTDPDGVDLIAAFSAGPRGCRDAVAWAARVGGLTPPRPV